MIEVTVMLLMNQQMRDKCGPGYMIFNKAVKAWAYAKAVRASIAQPAVLETRNASHIEKVLLKVTVNCDGMQSRGSRDRHIHMWAIRRTQ
jgi:hypothetical protein